MNRSAAAAAAAAAEAGCQPPFTASQWQELEHQALIFKYLMAGIPVPPELLLPIRKSFESMAAHLYHPSMEAVGYCFYGKKLDPEPGRCRRTDGKKWRCSKDAYPDSKYCERHMHRSRNRSRKPVESLNLSQSQTVASLAPSGSRVSTGSQSGTGGSFGSGIPLEPLHRGSNSATQVTFTGSSFNQLQTNPGSHGMSNRDYRYLGEAKREVDGHSLFSEASGTLGINSSLDRASYLMPSQVLSSSLSESRNDSFLPESYSHMQSMQGLGHVTISSIPKQQQQQHCWLGSYFDSTEPVKQASHPLRPFFDEWPKTRVSWSDLEDERSSGVSSSTTQLSISLPMPSDFTTTSRSPNGVP